MKNILGKFFFLTLVFWLISLYPKLDLFTLAVARKELINFTGILAFAYFSLAIYLAIKPSWLEKSLGGLDKLYKLHKHAGIAAGVFSLLHWLIKLSKPLLKQWFVLGAKIPRIPSSLDFMRSLAKDLGEVSLYLILAMLVLALLKTFPYKIWRWSHKLFAVLYLAIVIHALVLTPIDWWLHPLGFSTALAGLVGSYAAIKVLTGTSGKAKQLKGKLISIKQLANGINLLTCRLDKNWRYQPGQFALVGFSTFEGMHPFTIYSYDSAKQEAKFAIKPLGDFTSNLHKKLLPNMPVKLEGAYGGFTLPQEEQQLWVAAGIGITPFMAWLEGLAETSLANKTKIKLVYCVTKQEEAIFTQELAAFSQQLPNFSYELHLSANQGRLKAEQLIAANAEVTSLSYCGPKALRQSLHKAWLAAGKSKENFYSEEFDFR